MAPWVYDPHSGGIKILARLKEPIKQRILGYAAKHYAGKYNWIDVRFRDKFCYIDAYLEPDIPEKNFNEELYGCTWEERIEFLRTVPTHLCRLRYNGDTEKWAMAFLPTATISTNLPCIETAPFSGRQRRHLRPHQFIFNS